MKKNDRFKLFFKDKDNQILDLDYKLHESIVAEKWFRQIKHLKNIPIDEIESYLVDLSDLRQIHKEFCEFAGIQYRSLPAELSQDYLNNMHQLYENLHNTLSRKKNNSALYKFHHAIHFYESKELNATIHNETITVGWGVKGGPLEESFPCNPYYSDKIIQNNLYLPWAELGKTPLQYFKNGEPSNQSRFNQLAKPHITLRSRFYVAKNNKLPKPLDKEFIEWFKNFEQEWLEHHKIPKWNEIDEECAPLLAHAEHNYNLSNEKFLRIET